jgi:hypothetical protein
MNDSHDEAFIDAQFRVVRLTLAFLIQQIGLATTREYITAILDSEEQATRYDKAR